MRFNDFNIQWGEKIFRKTKRITLELSNLCNYSLIHHDCPINSQKTQQILPESIFNSVLNTCNAYDFQGVISFHMYNEPLIDPRLFRFMERVKKTIPKARLFLLTNGWYLDQNLCRDLELCGLDFLEISAYSESEYLRFKKLKSKINIRIEKRKLDNRLNWYNEIPKDNLPKPCYCPLYEICITCIGKVILCPYDWQREHVFGDLNKESLEQILQKTKIWNIYESLSTGHRSLKLCKNCISSRGEPFINEK